MKKRAKDERRVFGRGLRKRGHVKAVSHTLLSTLDTKTEVTRPHGNSNKA